jgi:hypothetical protein
MLEHGEPTAREFLEQLAVAEVTPWRCPCGCGSINFQMKGRKPAPPGVRILGDFMFGPDDAPAGIFIFESAGLLSGIEITDLPAMLRQSCRERMRFGRLSLIAVSRVSSTFVSSKREDDLLCVLVERTIDSAA